MNLEIANSKEYRDWLQEIKTQLKLSQTKAALQVNQALIQFYWELGNKILEKQEKSNWGDLLIKQLSSDLMREFPNMKGFSRSNLFYIRKWVAFYQQSEIVQRPVGLLQKAENQSIDWEIIPQLVGLIPWGQNLEIITKCKTVIEAVFYLKATIKHNWSRPVLVTQIKSKLYERTGTAINNFADTLPLPQSDLANEILKNPYNFEFLSLSNEVREKKLEDGLVGEIQKFLLELGQGFAFIGRQYHLKVGQSDFYLDLLFYHVKLKAYCVVELKSVPFQPEFAGKLNFYLNAIDARLKDTSDNQTIGILLCTIPDSAVVEYSLKNIGNPLGVAQYKVTYLAPDSLRDQLPSAEDFAAKLTHNSNF